jgi:hypothetical protein
VKPPSIISERTVKNENDECGKVIYMGDIQGPEKVNDTCVITVDRGFIVCHFRILY